MSQNKATHKVYYRITDYGSYVDVVLFVERYINGEYEQVLVSQKEAEFNNLEQAKPLILHFDMIGAEYEVIEVLDYTG